MRVKVRALAAQFQARVFLDPMLSSSRYRNPNCKPAWYKSRQRSITPAQKRAEKALWPLFGLTYSHGNPLDLAAAFGRPAPRVLEIGCGSGEAIVELAARRPDHDFVAVDWMRRGLASCLSVLEERELSNVRLVRADAASMLSDALDGTPSIDEALFFFPDPWRGSPERRLVRPDVIASLSRVMRPNGCLRVATDVRTYPDHVRATLAAAPGWRPVPCADIEEQRPGHFRPSTKYEREAIAEGRPIEDLCFVWCPDEDEGGEG